MRLFHRGKTLPIDVALYSDAGTALFILRGHDAVRYLHGRLTQDIKHLQAGEGARALVLTPQGRIKGKLLVLRDPESFLLLSDPLPTPAQKDEFTSALLQFKVADDVHLEAIPNTSVLSVIGTNADELLQTALRDLPQQPYSHIQGELNGRPLRVVNNPLGNIPRFELCARESDLAEIEKELERQSNSKLLRLSEEHFHVQRILQMQPLMGLDLNEKILAPEIPLTDLVSFNKGCYAGQEVVEMATARGRPNRKLVLLESSEKLLPGSDIYEIDASGKEKSVGHISSLAFSAESSRCFALGFVKTALPADSRLSICGSEARMRESGTGQ